MGKQQVIIYLVVCIALFSYGLTSLASKKTDNQMLPLVEVFKENGIELEKWSVYAKEQISGADEDLLEAQMETVLKQFPRGHIVAEKNGQDKQVIISQTAEYEEKVILTLMENGDLYKIYQANGEKWREGTSLFQKINLIFIDKPQVFSCVQGVVSGIIERGIFKLEQEILKKLQGTPVERVEEGAFIATSAYTEQYDYYLPTGKNKMNLQIALREDKRKNETKITIGTPMITTEY